MTRLKRYFPIPYLIVGSVAIGLVIRDLVREPEVSLAGVGALIAIVPLVTFMSSLVLLQRARTGRNQYLMLALAVIGTVIAFVGFESPETWYALFLGVIPSFMYVFWYSVLDRSASAGLSVGSRLPELGLLDAAGNPVRPSEGKHALYMFIRGNWCPLCMAQVKEIAAQYQELQARGVEVFLISRQKEENTEALAKRFDVPLRFCVDPDGRIAQMLGIEHLGGVPFMMEPLGYKPDTVLPTVLITDPSGTIIFVHLTDNYRVRPEPSTFLAAIDASA